MSTQADGIVLFEEAMATVKMSDRAWELDMKLNMTQVMTNGSSGEAEPSLGRGAQLRGEISNVLQR
jgi:hypothetical protein